MIKSISFMKRKPGMSREEFMRYYEDVHAPQAVKIFKMKRYVRNYVIVPPGAPEPDFDCLTEFWYETAEDARAALKLSKSPDGQTDEADFMDVGKMVFFQVEERISQ